MSSYLTLYGLPKEGKPISIVSYSRSNDIYQAFRDNADITHIGMEEPQYTEITPSVISEVLKGLKEDIDKATQRLIEYEKHAAGNLEIIDEIISSKEYINDLTRTLHQVEFIGEIVNDAQYEWTGFDKILANVD